MQIPEEGTIKDRPGRMTLTMAVLVATCAFMAILSFSMFYQLKNSDRILEKEKASFKKQEDELKDRLARLEAEKRSLEEDFKSLEAIFKEKQAKNDRAISLLKHENTAARKRIEAYKRSSAGGSVKDAASGKVNELIRRVFSRALDELDTSAGNTPARNEPAVSARGDVRQDDAFPPRQGKIVSIDRKNAMIVIDTGAARGVREGQRCRIFGDRGEVASAVIIRTRYEMSAAAVDAFISNHTIRDVDEGVAVEID